MIPMTYRVSLHCRSYKQSRLKGARVYKGAAKFLQRLTGNDFCLERLKRAEQGRERRRERPKFDLRKLSKERKAERAAKKLQGPQRGPQTCGSGTLTARQKAKMRSGGHVVEVLTRVGGKEVSAGTVTLRLARKAKTITTVRQR